MNENNVKTIDIIPSKSFAHRAYICDFLAGGTGGGVRCGLDSDDIRATKGCLDALRAGDDTLDCGESGSTLRFMLPLTGVLGRTVTFRTHGRLAERPMGPLEDELKAHGMCIDHLKGGEIQVSGQLEAGLYRLPGTVSSQFITGLLLSLPYLDGDSRIELTTPLKSSAYVDITVSVLADFGVRIHEHDGAYDISGHQEYACSGPQGIYEVEGDWSQAAFWFASGLIGRSPVLIRGLRNDSVQGDRKIVDVLKNMGGDIEIVSGPDGETDGTGFLARPSELHGTITDVSEIPDLAPAIAAAAVSAEGVTRLTNAERLRLKESDRIDSITGCLNDLGFTAEGRPDEIIIYGDGGKDRKAVQNTMTAETAGDHRIVMMAAVLSLITPDRVKISGSKAVSKSYPTFFDEFDKAGMGNNLIRA